MYLALSLVIALAMNGVDKEHDLQTTATESLLRHIHHQFVKQCEQSGIKKVKDGKEKCALLQSFIECEQVWSSDRVYEWAHYSEERHCLFADLMQEREVPFINGQRRFSNKKRGIIKLRFNLPQKLTFNPLLSNIYKVDNLVVELDKYSRCRYIPNGWRSGNTVCSIQMPQDEYTALINKIDNEK